jgi:thiamine-monophosphate kinase
MALVDRGSVRAAGGDAELHAAAGDGPTVAEVGERALIARLRRRLPAPAPGIVLGVGDDAAVIEPARGMLEVLTADTLVEGVHFDGRLCSAADVGHKALAVNVSDLASMGATPRLALLSLGLPDVLPVARFDGFVDGFLEAAAQAGVAVVGGNMTRSPAAWFIDVTLLGTARRRRVLTRSGGRPGDELFVTGTLGAARAGLAWLTGAVDPSPAPEADEVVAEAVTR